MMTGLLIAERHASDEKVLISAKAAAVPGSATGVLPKGKSVPLGPLLQALLMISGNDAAVALAEHDAGSAPAFVSKMNERAQELALGCTHFSTPNGLRDHGNYSCADDLATLARLDLANPALSAIAARHDASPAFPIKGGKLHLASNNPFILKRVPGVTGLKTGYTSLAGRCYVITERHAGRHLGVVLLNSPDPLRQVPLLLKAGFEAPR
jgi:D-alanyl-D-alanine carboxypeptidase (penicillin-binding protein 5/6)